MDVHDHTYMPEVQEHHLAIMDRTRPCLLSHASERDIMTNVYSARPWVVDWYVRKASAPTVYMGGPDSPELAAMCERLPWRQPRLSHGGANRNGGKLYMFPFDSFQARTVDAFYTRRAERSASFRRNLNTEMGALVRQAGSGAFAHLPLKLLPPMPRFVMDNWVGSALQVQNMERYAGTLAQSIFHLLVSRGPQTTASGHVFKNDSMDGPLMFPLFTLCRTRSISSMCVARHRFVHLLDTGTYTDSKFGSIDLDEISMDQTGEIWVNINSERDDESDVVWFDGCGLFATYGC